MFANSDGEVVLPASGIIIPKAHRRTVFDLTPEEVTATFELLNEPYAGRGMRWRLEQDQNRRPGDRRDLVCGVRTAARAR